MQGQPFIYILLRQLKQQNIEEVVILTGYLASVIEKHIGDGKKFGLKIKFSRGDESFDTGKRLTHALPLLDDHFLLLYSDNFWEDFDLAGLEKFYHNHQCRAVICVYDNNLLITTNNILVDAHGYVQAYDKSRKNPHLNGVEIGFFILQKNIIEQLPADNLSFEKTVLPQLIKERELAGFITSHRYYSIGNHDTYFDLNRYLRSKKTIFIDRDGVINQKSAPGTYIQNISDFIFLPNVIEAIDLLKKAGYMVIVISNQAGIGRRVFSLKTLEKIHTHMKQEFKKHDVTIDGLYLCPHDWVDNCSCRKPAGGLFYKAAEDFNLSLRHTTFIGDDVRDMMVADNIGCRGILLPDGNNLLQCLKSNQLI